VEQTRQKLVNKRKFVAVYSFEGDVDQVQLSFPAGSAISVRPGHQPKSGWWWGTYRNKKGNVQHGWFPSEYVLKFDSNDSYSCCSLAPVQEEIDEE
jgi:hypothetical protein